MPPPTSQHHSTLSVQERDEISRFASLPLDAQRLLRWRLSRCLVYRTARIHQKTRHHQECPRKLRTLPLSLSDPAYPQALADYAKRIRARDSDLQDSAFQPQLCNRCRSVRWAEVAAVEVPVTSYLLFEIGESQKQLHTSECCLCGLIGRLHLGNRNHLEVRSIREFISGSKESQDTKSYPLLELVVDNRPTFQAMLRQSDSDIAFVPRKIDPELLDYSVLRQWLSTCEVSHGTFCASTGDVHLAGFRVIDCWCLTVRSTVVPAPRHCRYVALSYVWGRGTEDVSKLQPPYSRTIQDAISVTIKLGFRYLWVDRLCINQDNVYEKHVQIRNMDIIYSQAQLTIIAAAGNSPAYGLPGVSTRLRRSQQRLNLGDIELVETFLRSSNLKFSAWAGRAWTFQEGVLSKRRLIFTDEEVYFYCNRTYCAESVCQTSKQPGSHTDESLSLWPRRYDSPRGWTPEENQDPWDLLSEYARRNLTYQSDALDACLGVLNRVCQAHLWGIPLTKDPNFSHCQMALSWDHTRQTRRRVGFPSWSWTAWQGVMGMMPCPGPNDLPPVIHLLRTVHGEQISLQDFYNLQKDRFNTASADPHWPKILQIKAPCIRPAFVDRAWVNITRLKSEEMLKYVGLRDLDHRPGVLIPLSQDKFELASVYLDDITEDKRLITKTLLVVIYYNFEDTRLMGLLVKRVGFVYSRVGIVYSSAFSTSTDTYRRIHTILGGEKPLWLKNAEMQAIALA